MPPFRTTLAGIGSFAALVPTLAFGDASAGSRAAALDAEGRRLMATQDYTGACAKFAESQSLDATPMAALDLGSCYEKAGKLGSAFAAYRSAAAAALMAHDKGRGVAARKSISRLESKAPRITIRVTDTTRSAGLEIRCDGDAVDPADWGRAIPRDAGGHDIEASAPGKKEWQIHVDLDDSSKTVVDVPSLEDEGRAKVATEANGGGSPNASSPPEGGSEDSGPRSGQTQRIVGIVIAGAGIAGLAAGVVAGISANSANGDLKSACGAGPTCDPSHASLHDSAIGWATLSDIAFIAGGAALAAGAVIYLTAPHDNGVSMGIGPSARGAGLSFLGRF